MQKISYEIQPQRTEDAIANLLKSVADVLEERGAVIGDSPALLKLQGNYLRCVGLKKGRSLELFGGDRR